MGAIEPRLEASLERHELEGLLNQVAAGSLSPHDAVARIATAPIADLGYARPDLDRGIRQGVSEVVYGAGKTAEQIAGIVSALVRGGQSRVLVTRVDDDKFAEVRRLLDLRPATPAPAAAPSAPDSDLDLGLDYDPISRTAIVGGVPEPDGNAYVAVCAAGTSDLYCAEEAARTAEMLGSRVLRLYDVGVSGIHRLLAHTDEIQGASAVVAIAGMEGALASVVGGLAPCPVIACPTSVGYGASLGGITALLAMLNSCASGVSVVNIDNGFGAGYQAALIDHAGRA
jgi:NCAIR mutase (PurE)-related protein